MVCFRAEGPGGHTVAHSIKVEKKKTLLPGISYQGYKELLR